MRGRMGRGRRGGLRGRRDRSKAYIRRWEDRCSKGRRRWDNRRNNSSRARSRWGDHSSRSREVQGKVILGRLGLGSSSSSKDSLVKDNLGSSNNSRWRVLRAGLSRRRCRLGREALAGWRGRRPQALAVWGLA